MGKLFLPTQQPSKPKKSEIEFVILFMRVHVHSIDTEINRWSLEIIRFSQRTKNTALLTYKVAYIRLIKSFL